MFTFRFLNRNREEVACGQMEATEQLWTFLKEEFELSLVPEILEEVSYLQFRWVLDDVVNYQKEELGHHIIQSFGLLFDSHAHPLPQTELDYTWRPDPELLMLKEMKALADQQGWETIRIEFQE